MTEKEKARNEIILSVLSEFNIGMDDLTSHCRLERFVQARVEAAKRLKDLGLTITRIGKLLHRDHTTVSYWLSGRRNGYIPQSLRIPNDVRDLIVSIANERDVPSTKIISEWLCEHAESILEERMGDIQHEIPSPHLAGQPQERTAQGQAEITRPHPA